MTRKTPQRADLEQPYRQDYVASNEKRFREGVMPSKLEGLIRWYEERWWEETPDRLHSRGIWKSDGEIVRGIPTETGYHGQPMQRLVDSGGSKMGTPHTSGAFERFIEGSRTASDADGYFQRPLAAALHAMAFGEGRGNGRPFIARWLYRVAMAGFDWRSAADSMGKVHDEAELLTHKGLEILWRLYSERPNQKARAA